MRTSEVGNHIEQIKQTLCELWAKPLSFKEFNDRVGEAMRRLRWESQRSPGGLRSGAEKQFTLIQ
jgi:hypothetical protein